MKIYPWYTKIN